MKDEPSELPADLFAATESLAETLLHAEPILAYRNARARYDADPSARKLLRELSQAQSELRRRQAENTITRELMERVQTLRREAKANHVVVDFAEAERAALAFLPGVNQEISALLGFDFATLAGRSCC